MNEDFEFPPPISALETNTNFDFEIPASNQIIIDEKTRESEQINELKIQLYRKEEENEILRQQKNDLNTLVDEMKDNERQRLSEFNVKIEKLESEMNFYKQEAQMLQ